MNTGLAANTLFMNKPFLAFMALLYATVKSLENNCKLKKKSQDPDLKYQVRYIQQV